MKKRAGILIVMAVFFTCVPAARADYVVSLGFTNADRPIYGKRHGRDRLFYTNYGHYPHGYYYWPPRPHTRVYTQTVIKTIEVQPKQAIFSDQEKLGISDIIFLSKAGINDDVIIDKIATTRAVFKLTAEEVSTLVKEGVSNRVINFMLNTAKKAAF
ncbi:MAG: hypothetical protein ACE14U_00620 [Candidatus Velamenicoccus archaeovorus]